MRFLDVAAGSGALSLPAARMGAQVLAADLSPAMLEQLERRSREEALSVETRVMDGHALALDDDSFDIAGSQFGVMLFPDLAQGLREMARVVKLGGRVLMTVYGDPHEIEFLGFFIAAVQAVVPTFEGPPMDPLPLPFHLRRAPVGLADPQQPDRRHDPRRPQPRRRPDRRRPTSAARLGPRSRRRQRPGSPDRTDQHRDRDEVKRGAGRARRTTLASCGQGHARRGPRSRPAGRTGPAARAAGARPAGRSAQSPPLVLQGWLRTVLVTW
jgi:SAM-dependent methyltransferase